VPALGIPIDGGESHNAVAVGRTAPPNLFDVEPQPAGVIVEVDAGRTGGWVPGAQKVALEIQRERRIA
jgi:hypothetical protein